MGRSAILCVLAVALAVATSFETSEIHGYHFHTYFFQKDVVSTAEARVFWDAIQEQIKTGILPNCRINRFNMEPVGPHPVGSFETCCNATGISTSLSWFTQNHGNLSIFLHPLTTEEMLDHTVRAGFFGDSFKLKLSALSETINKPDLCLPIDLDHDNEI